MAGAISDLKKNSTISNIRNNPISERVTSYNNAEIKRKAIEEYIDGKVKNGYVKTSDNTLVKETKSGKDSTKETVTVDKNTGEINIQTEVTTMKMVKQKNPYEAEIEKTYKLIERIKKGKTLGSADTLKWLTQHINDLRRKLGLVPNVPKYDVSKGEDVKYYITPDKNNKLTSNLEISKALYDKISLSNNKNEIIINGKGYSVDPRLQESFINKTYNNSNLFNERFNSKLPTSKLASSINSSKDYSFSDNRLNNLPYIKDFIYANREVDKGIQNAIDSLIYSPLRGTWKNLKFSAQNPTRGGIGAWNPQEDDNIEEVQKKYLDLMKSDSDVMNSNLAIGSYPLWEYRLARLLGGGLGVYGGVKTAIDNPSISGVTEGTIYAGTGIAQSPVGERVGNVLNRATAYKDTLAKLELRHGVDSPEVNDFKSAWNYAFNELSRFKDPVKDWTSKDVEAVSNELKAIEIVDRLVAKHGKDLKVIGTTAITPQSSLTRPPRGKSGDVDITKGTEDFILDVYNEMKRNGYDVKLYKENWKGTDKYHLNLDGKEFINMASDSTGLTYNQIRKHMDLLDLTPMAWRTDSSGVNMLNIRDQMRAKTWAGFVEESRPKDIIDAIKVADELNKIKTKDSFNDEFRKKQSLKDNKKVEIELEEYDGKEWGNKRKIERDINYYDDPSNSNYVNIVSPKKYLDVSSKDNYVSLKSDSPYRTSDIYKNIPLMKYRFPTGIIPTDITKKTYNDFPTSYKFNLNTRDQVLFNLLNSDKGTSNSSTLSVNDSDGVVSGYRAVGIDSDGREFATDLYETYNQAILEGQDLVDKKDLREFKIERKIASPNEIRKSKTSMKKRSYVRQGDVFRRSQLRKDINNSNDNGFNITGFVMNKKRYY